MFNNIYSFFKLNKFKPSTSNLLRVWLLNNSRKFYVSEESVLNTLIGRLWPIKLKKINMKKIKTTFFFKFLFIIIIFCIFFILFLITKMYLNLFLERNYILSNFKEIRKLGDPYIINFDWIINSSFFNFLVYHQLNFFNLYFFFFNFFLKLHVSFFFFSTI